MRVTGSLQVKRGIYQMMTRVIFDDGTIKQKSKSSRFSLLLLARRKGLEPPTLRTGIKNVAISCPFIFILLRNLRDEI